LYAVTRAHVEKYFELVEMLAQSDNSLLDLIERYHDFIVISQAGVMDPRIHKIGRIHRNVTFRSSEVALHRDEGWASSVSRVYRAVEAIRSPELKRFEPRAIA
jgi:hypothetical protein